MMETVLDRKRPQKGEKRKTTGKKNRKEVILTPSEGSFKSYQMRGDSPGSS